ncbi:MAG: sulfatase, partial [Planctomycetota bacterium]
SLWLQLLLILAILCFSMTWIFFHHQNDTYAMVIGEYSTIWRIQSEPYRLDYFPDRMQDLKKLDPGTFSFHQMPQLPKYQIPEDFPSQKPPIFIVLWDAGRSDHFSCYGYSKRTTPPRKTTPNVDRFAQDAVVFENAYSQATATTTGMRHLLIGKYTTRYMLDQENVNPFWLHKLIPLGYENFLVNALGSFYNGVPREAYTLKMPDYLKQKLHYFPIEGSEEDRVKNLFKVIDQNHLQNGFFSLLHYISTHLPWENHSEATYYGEGYMDKYDNSINYLDLLFGKFIEGLKQRNLYDKAIIILLADHGTGLNDHGRWGSFLPYQEQIRVPLIMKIPGVPPQRIQEMVGLIDVGPTLLNLFHQEIPNSYDGLSLLPLLEGKMTTLPRDYLFNVCSFEDAYTLIERQKWKCVVHRRRQYWKLYDLEKDPHELRNLASERPEMIQHFRDIFKQYFSNGLFSYSNPYHYRAWSYLENH